MAALPPRVSFVPFATPPLPPGWTEHQAPGGQTYYHNASMNQSTYVRPLPGVPFPIPGAMPFVPQGAVIPGAAPPKEKKKKERPLVKTPVPGTAWLRVKTTEGNIFWTHKERKESVWEVPEEIREEAAVMEREEAEKAEREAGERVRRDAEEREREMEEEKRREREEVQRVMEEVKDAVAAGKRKAAEPVEDDKPAAHKKARVADEVDGDHDEEWQRQMAGEMAAEAETEEAQPEQQENQEKTVEDTTSPAEEDTSQDSAANPDGTANPPFTVPNRVDLSLDESKALFKTLLHEKQVNPLHPWDTSLPLFISDPRYVLLPSVSARREAFDEYCRDAIRAQRLAKAAAFKEESRHAREGDGKAGEGDKDREAYARLLRDEVTSTRATWHEFRRKWKKDRRFFGWAGDRERERVFREWVKDLGEVKKKAAAKAEREFFQLLREHAEITPGDGWKEAKRKLDPKDPRYDAVGSSSLREELFSTYVKALGGDLPAEKGEKPSDGHEDDGAARRKQRAERAERGLREREEKVRRERAGLERELGRTRGAVGREEGEREFMTFLTDAVRDPNASWDAAVAGLSRDARFVLCALPLAAQRALFAAHVARLREKHLAGLHALFEAHAPGLGARWPELGEGARRAVRGSAASGKLGLGARGAAEDVEEDGNERDGDGDGDALEAEFARWQRARGADARQAFDAMLTENAFLEFWGRVGKGGGGEAGAGPAVAGDEEEEGEGEGGGGRADLKRLAKAVDGDEVGKVLKNDLRWTAFDHVPEQRARWLTDYMERLAAPKLSVHVPDKGAR